VSTGQELALYGAGFLGGPQAQSHGATIQTQHLPFADTNAPAVLWCSGPPPAPRWSDERNEVAANTLNRRYLFALLPVTPVLQHGLCAFVLLIAEWYKEHRSDGANSAVDSSFVLRSIPRDE
jgi:hypothetical protein